MNIKNKKLFDLINFVEDEIIPKLEYVRNEMDELFPELQESKGYIISRDKLAESIEKAIPSHVYTGRILPLLGEHVERHSFIRPSHKAKMELANYVLKKCLKGTPENEFDMSVLTELIYILRDAGYSFSYTSNRIIFEKTWKADHKNNQP